jgi:RNase P/RNase MRP subunit p29
MVKKSLKGELIGLTIRITNSKNKTDIGKQGKIIDETKNMIFIERKKGIKKFIKKNISIEVIKR